MTKVFDYGVVDCLVSGLGLIICNLKDLLEGLLEGRVNAIGFVDDIGDYVGSFFNGVLHYLWFFTKTTQFGKVKR